MAKRCRLEQTLPCWTKLPGDSVGLIQSIANSTLWGHFSQGEIPAFEMDSSHK